MARIFPSLLAADPLTLHSTLDQLITLGVDGVHMDIMDGHFVPNLSFGPDIVKAVEHYLPTDTHLMVHKPEQFLEMFIKTHTKSLSFHIEACDHPLRYLQHIQSHNMKAGLAMNPHTPVASLLPCLPFVDFVLVMSVNPGFGGQAFLPHTLETLSELKQAKGAQSLNFSIHIDGGVTGENAKACVDAGADTLIMGNAFFKHHDPSKLVTFVQSLA